MAKRQQVIQSPLLAMPWDDIKFKNVTLQLIAYRFATESLKLQGI